MRGPAAFVGLTRAVDDPYGFLEGSSGMFTVGSDLARGLVLHATGGGARVKGAIDEIAAADGIGPLPVCAHRPGLSKLHGVDGEDGP